MSVLLFVVHVSFSSTIQRLKLKILSDLNQVAPNHIAEESQTCLRDTPPDDDDGPVVYLANTFDSQICEVTRALVAVEPRRPPKTNVSTETAFRHDHCKRFQKSKSLLR